MARQKTKKAVAVKAAVKAAAKPKAAAPKKRKAATSAVSKPRTAGKVRTVPTVRASAREDTTSQLVTLVSRLVSRALATRLAPKGIGYGQLPVLFCLWEEDGLTQKELSQRVRIEAPTMVRTLDRMEREGLVERVRSEKDRRQIHIRLTRKGRGLEKSLGQLAAEVNDVSVGGISKKDQGLLNQSLAKIVGNLEKDAQAAR